MRLHVQNSGKSIQGIACCAFLQQSCMVVGISASCTNTDRVHDWTEERRTSSKTVHAYPSHYSTDSRCLHHPQWNLRRNIRNHSLPGLPYLVQDLVFLQYLRSKVLSYLEESSKYFRTNVPSGSTRTYVYSCTRTRTRLVLACSLYSWISDPLAFF